MSSAGFTSHAFIDRHSPLRRRLLVWSLAAAGCLIAGSAAGASKDVTTCVDVVTLLDAGGDVSDKDLGAARQACTRAQQTSLDSHTKLQVDSAISTLGDEAAKRQAAHPR